MLLTHLADAITDALHTENSVTAAREGTNRQSVILSLFFTFSAFAAIVFIFRKLIDKQTITSLGMETNGYRDHAATGFFLGLFYWDLVLYFLLQIKTFIGQE